MRSNLKKTLTLVAFGTAAVSGVAYADIFANWDALQASTDYVAGVDYDVQVDQVSGWNGEGMLHPGRHRAVIAIHGGNIETQTSQLAYDIAHLAETDAAVVCHANGGNCGEVVVEWFANLFRMNGHVVAGKKQDGTAKANSDLHITATNFDEDQAVTMVTNATRCLSIHGMADDATVPDGAICVGGLDADSRQRFWTAVTGDSVLHAQVELIDVQRGTQTSWGNTVPTNSKCHGLSATQTANIINLCGASVDPNVPGGIQLEMNKPLRDKLKTDTTLRERFILAARAAIP
jgi:phage replication-related protein YjqB (UPF0714/DUF867 family)